MSAELADGCAEVESFPVWSARRLGFGLCPALLITQLVKIVHREVEFQVGVATRSGVGVRGRRDGWRKEETKALFSDGCTAPRPWLGRIKSANSPTLP